MANNHGRMVWYELLTNDTKAALAFYTEVMGWKTQAFDHEYTMFVTAQGATGGVGVLPEQAKQMGAPPYWQGNFIVDNVDATVAKVKELGGKVLHVEAVPTVGKLAVIADPQGAVIAIITPANEMAAHDTSKAGEFQWHELYTTDNEAAFNFYSAIAGWQKIDTYDMGPMGKYILWGRDGKTLGGMMTMKEVPPGWLYYVTTPDLEGTLARATAKGAKVINGPMDVPGGQRIVQLKDPQGAHFALVTPPKA